MAVRRESVGASRHTVFVTETTESEDSSIEAGNAPPERSRSQVTLRSLAPSYLDSQHSGYVRHLENAIEDTRNRNIALTGRYGAGKSSVLDQFESKHKDKTLRISIHSSAWRLADSNNEG